MKESELMHLVLDWLAAKQILAFRMNTGAMKMEKRFVKFGVPGMSDILAFPQFTQGEYDYPYPLWIECKVGRNGQSDLQKSFQKQVEREGHKYILCYTLECVQAHFL